MRQCISMENEKQLFFCMFTLSFGSLEELQGCRANERYFRFVGNEFQLEKGKGLYKPLEIVEVRHIKSTYIL